MKDFIKHFRIGPLHLYITTRKLRNRGCAERLRRNARRAIKGIKILRYHKTDGRCEVCGQKFGIRVLDMHHILPVDTHPELVAQDSNLLMVCRGCHMQLHRKTKEL